MNWDLTKLYKSFDDEKLEADFARAEAGIAELRNMLAAPGADAGALVRACLIKLREIGEATSLVGSYVMLTLSTDTQNQPALMRYERLMALQVEGEQASSAFKRYVSGLADLEGVIASDPLIEEHAYQLRCAAREAAHVLDPAIEPAVLKMQMTGGEAWSQLHEQLTATLMIDIEVDGEAKKLPLSAVRGMAMSPDAATRKRAYEAELAAYPRIEFAMAACLNGIKGEALTMCELRHYASVLDTALESARIDNGVLDAMLTAMRESLPAFRRYFRAKAKLLGHEGGLPFYDLFAPVGKSKGEYTLDEAREVLVRVLGKFSGKMGAFIGRAFDERWIDAFPYEGKRGGAFCASVHPLGISYVLSNFEGSLASVGTLAHELGHAYHGDCLKDASILNSDYPMTLAETASIFNETLLMEKLREEAGSEERLMLLDQQVSDAAQVIVDILSRFLFESEVLSRRADHQMLPRELNEIMLDAQRQTYGDGLCESALHPYMWACKGHYYSPGLHFYNFPYAFGLLFGMGVYAIYQEKGEAFVPEYDALLRRTGLGDVREVAASVGIDVGDVNFWRKSLKVIGGMIDEIEALAK